MGRKRIHQLAAEWGVTSKDILERLDKMGIKGKKAQSGLSEGEIQRVYDEMGLATAEEPRVVTHRSIDRGESGPAETVVTETRLKRGVFRRRTRRTMVHAEDANGGLASQIAGLGVAVATAVNLSPDLLASLDPDQELHGNLLVAAGAAEPVIEEPEAIEEEEHEPADIEHAPIDEADREAASVEEEEGEEEAEAPIEEPEKLAEEMLNRAEQAKGTASPEEASAGPRVLGRTDLTRKPKPVLPQQKQVETAPGKAHKQK